VASLLGHLGPKENDMARVIDAKEEFEDKLVEKLKELVDYVDTNVSTDSWEDINAYIDPQPEEDESEPDRPELEIVSEELSMVKSVFQDVIDKIVEIEKHIANG
jgi:hypothetical protein